MNKEIQRFTIAITLKAPILTQTSGAVGHGFDAAMRRDEMQRPALPGSLIKGNLRHSWEQLHQITNLPEKGEIDHWLGTPSPESSDDAPKRGLLVFAKEWSDLQWQKNRDTHKRFRIKIDQATGAVEDGALMAIESPYAAGESITFTGHIDAELNKDEGKKLKQMLEKGLGFIPALGALKGNGFGQIIKVAVTTGQTKVNHKPFANQHLTLQPIGLRIIPEQPFCFAKPAIGKENHFETENHIPGGALVAAIAQRISNQPERWPTLAENLEHLHFTHALPVQAGGKKRPIKLPLSIVKIDQHYLNIAQNSLSDTQSEEPPIFNIDWKPDDWATPLARYNPLVDNNAPTEPTKVLDIRTAISKEDGRAEHSNLFSMEMVSPKGFHWLANLNPSATIELTTWQTILQELHELLQQPLTHLGKTKTSAQVVFEEPYLYTCKEAGHQDGKVAIYLQSPTRLLPTGFHSAGTNHGHKLKQDYQAAWHELSAGSLKLNHFYAQQHLLGGNYWWNRFVKPHAQGINKPYHPEVFTSPGSVFIMDILDPEKAKSHLERWQQTGLPQLQNTQGGESWKQNPWIKTNGYGEIMLNIEPATTRDKS